MRNLRGLMALISISTALMGCKQQAPEPPIWEQVKISDLASDKSKNSDKPALNALNIEVHVYCVPATNLEKLKDLWELLRLRGPRYRNQQAFKENGFRVARARITVWDTLAAALTRVQAQKERTVSFLLSPGYDSDLPLVRLDTARDISFTGMEGSVQRIRIGPGSIAWRLRVEKSPSGLQETRLTAYPVFKLAGIRPMLHETRLADASQIAFMCAAFNVRMGFGDLIVLGPEASLGDGSTLGGQFFGIPHQLFLGLDPQEPVKTCPAVRLFVLTCSGTR